VVNKELSDREARLVNKLSGHGDVAIKILFRVTRGRWPDPEAEPRRIQQQYIGVNISRANLKLKKESQRIVPGIKRGTYRLIKI